MVTGPAAVVQPAGDAPIMTKTQALIAAIFVVAALRPLDARQSDQLRSLQLRMTVHGGDDFVTVESVGPDVRVRAIRVASIDEQCSLPVVQASERIFPRTTVAAIAGVQACKIAEQRVDKALKDAPGRYSTIDFLGSVDVVVAECGKREKVFLFQMPPLVDYDELQREAPDVSALWALGRRMRALAFTHREVDPDDPFDNPFGSYLPEVRTTQEALGTTLLPVLLNGAYEEYLRDQGFGSYRRAPTRREPAWVEVVDRASLNLVEYVEPIMPPIAISARLSGYVDLRLSVNAESGAVDGVEVVPGAPPLIAPAAVEAARRWRFAHESIPREPVYVRFVFRLRCPPRFQ